MSYQNDEPCETAAAVIARPSSLRAAKFSQSVVEDDVGIASFLLKGLKEAGYCIEHVGDGQTGLECLANDSFDAAIVDIMLPALDGLTLIQRARQHRTSRSEERRGRERV